MITSKIIADSVNPTGDRLTTFQLTYPRMIHAELMTHRKMSRNSASSRAIPVKKMMANIHADPAMPEFYGLNQAGMQSGKEATAEQIEKAQAIILRMRDHCLEGVAELNEMGFHKQLANRYIEPWMHITVIASMTSFLHFRKLRVHPMAEPHFQKLAGLMAADRDTNKPKILKAGEWHLPYVGFDGDEYLTEEELIAVSTARCARVSYLTHEGIRDVSKDIELHDMLSTNGHWSPFEHPSQACPTSEVHGNYTGFKQYRKFFPTEYVPDEPYEVAL